MFASDGGRAAGLAGLAVLLMIAGGPVAGAPRAASRPAAEARLVAPAPGDANVLEIDRSRLRQRAAANRRFTIDRFPLAADLSVDLELESFRVTGPSTRFVIGTPGGEDRPMDFDPDRVTLLRGNVIGEPGSHVFLAVSDWGTAGTVQLGPGGGTWGIGGGGVTPQGVRIPVRVAPIGASAQPDGVSPDVPFCAVPSPASLPVPPPPTALGSVLPEVTRQIELAVETDYELYILFNDVDATAAYLVSMWAASSDIYERDVNSRIEISFLRVWDQEENLYNSEDPLDEFQTYWNNNEQAVQRDVVQLDSGRRNVPYGGVAYVGALCNPDFGYGVVGYLIGQFVTGLPGVFAYDVHVTAHELGHNCGTFHTHDYGIDTCNNLTGPSERGTIMSYCSQTRMGGGANTDLRFHAICQQEMRNHIFDAQQDCLAHDCDGNGVEDADDISGGADDVNGNGILDECEDCNNNQVLDPDDISGGGSDDDNNNGIPDECEADCNGNNQPDDLDITLGVDTDLYGNNIPDGCEADCDSSGTSDYTEIKADMTLDLDRNTILDSCQDCDGDQTPDLDALGGAYNVWVASGSGDSGPREYLSLTGVLVKSGDTGLYDDAQDLIVTATGRILVSSGGDDRVVEYDETGAGVGDLVTAGGGGLDFPAGMVVSPGGTLLVCSRDTNSVLEYDLGDGTPLGAFVSAGSGGLSSPWGIGYGGNGNLFVTSGGNRVLEYDGGSGASVGEFVSVAGNGGLSDARGILFLPNGNLLVASRATDQLLEYNTAGTFQGQFNHAGTSTVLTLDEPWTMRLGPDGHVYASRRGVSVAQGEDNHNDSHLDDEHLNGHDVAGLHVNSTRIYIFNGANGDFVRSYVTGHDTLLSFPTGFDFVPGFTVDCNQNLVPDTCDIDSGASTDANGNGVPDECDTPGDADGDFDVDVDDFLAVLAAWGPCPNPCPPSCAADFNEDCVVGVDDFLTVLANWAP